jgi:hypothetical protein
VTELVGVVDDVVDVLGVVECDAGELVVVGE